MLERARIGFVALIPVILLASLACGPHLPCTPMLHAIEEGDVDVVREHMEFGSATQVRQYLTTLVSPC